MLAKPVSYEARQAESRVFLIAQLRKSFASMRPVTDPNSPEAAAYDEVSRLLEYLQLGMAMSKQS